MNFKPKRFWIGVICTNAILTFCSGVCEPVRSATKPSEQGRENGILTATMLKVKRKNLGSRLRLRRSNMDHRLLKSADPMVDTSTSGLSSFGPDHFQNHPSHNFKTNCNKGEVTYIVEGRADFEGAGQATAAHFPSGAVLSDTQTELRGALQPVVKCTARSMTLTVPRRWATQLRDDTGNDFSMPLSTLHLQCGYSIHKSWKDISIGVQFNGCHVKQEGDRYVLPLLWRRTRFKISCPLSPVKSQALDGLSLCCHPSLLETSIQGLSAAKELNVNVRGEWTPLLELIQRCGYNVDWKKTGIVIFAPFPGCGVISRGGKHVLSLQVGVEEFMLTCHTSYSELSQPSRPPPTTSTKPVPETPKPFQWAPPFYLAPPHYPQPMHRHQTPVHSSSALLPPVPTSYITRKLESPQRDEQLKGFMSPSDKHYNKPASPGDGLPQRIQASPARAPGYSPNLQPPNYAFHPYYLFYHHPKIPLTNWPPDPGYAAESKPPNEMTVKTPQFLNLTSNHPKPNPPMPHSSVYDYYMRRSNFDFRSPMRSNRPGPLPTSASARVSPSVKPTRSPTSPLPPYVSQMTTNSPMCYHLPHDFYGLYHLYHGSQGANWPSPASFPLPQQTINSIPLSVNPNIGFGSYFQPELPVQFKPGNDPAQGLNNEGKSAAHSDASYDGSSWEKWFNMQAQVNNIPELLHIFPPPFPVPLERTREDAGVQDPSSGSSVAQAFAPPYIPGTKSHFHDTQSPSRFTFPVKECTVGEYFVFSLPEFMVEPKVVGQGQSEGSCAVKRLTSRPHEYFVPLHDCGVTKQVMDSLVIYQLVLETCDSDNLLRMLVECRSYPGLPTVESLLIMEPLPVQNPVALQLRIATDESYSYRPEAHAPLSSLRGRLVFMELRLLRPHDPSVRLQVHYCLAYTLAPYASATLVYDRCLSGSEFQLLPSLSSDTQYIVISNFLSPNPSIVNDADPEVYFFCLSEACSASDAVCTAACSEMKMK